MGIRSFFFGPKVEKYVVHPPQFDNVGEYMQYIKQKYLEENAQLKAENIKLKEKLTKKKDEKIQEKRQLEISDELKKQRKYLDVVKKSRTLKLKLHGLKKYPVFFLRNNKAFYTFMGVYLQETEDGHILWYPWLRTPDRKDVKFNKPAYDFYDFFKEKIGIVSQIKGGKVDSNFDTDENGKPILRKDKTIKTEDGKKYKVIDLSDQERREYEQTIETLKANRNELYSQLIDAKKIISQYEKKIADLEVDNYTANMEKDIWASTIAAEAKQKPEAIQQVADVLSTIQDIKVQQILESRMNQTLLESVAKIRQKYSEAVNKAENEIEESKQRALVQESIGAAMRSLSRTPTSPPPSLSQQQQQPQGV